MPALGFRRDEDGQLLPQPPLPSSPAKDTAPFAEWRSQSHQEFASRGPAASAMRSMGRMPASGCRNVPNLVQSPSELWEAGSLRLRDRQANLHAPTFRSADAFHPSL